MTKQEIDLLKRIKSYIEPESMMTHAIYIPPAQVLRNQADLLEQKEMDIEAFKQFIQANLTN